MPVSIQHALNASELLPELVLLLAGFAVLLLGLSSSPRTRALTPWLAGIAILAAFALLARNPLTGEGYAIGGGLFRDAASEFVRRMSLIMGVLFVLTNWSQPAESERGEYFSMLLFSLIGLMLTGLADNLVVLFLALELVSIPTYIMVTLSRRDSRSLEAGTKYFYLGAMSAAVMAYGFSFLYGVGGTASIRQSISIGYVAEALASPGEPAFALVTIGLVLSIAGLCFKIAAVPFHFYIADVYQGTAGPVAGLLGFVPKLAGFVAILRIAQLVDWQTDYSTAMFWTLWAISVASMTVGNVLALMQRNVKRMLAYSGIAHSGYMLMGVIAAPTGSSGVLGDGFAAIFYYTVVYGIANLAAFTVLTLLRVRGEPCETLRDIAGLLRRCPGYAMLMALAMFSLMGLPPTAGFWGKLSLFGSVLAVADGAVFDRALFVLVIIGVVNSAIAAAYYLRVIAACLLYENDEPAEAVRLEFPRMGAILCGLLLLYLTFRPNSLLQSGRRATDDFRNAAARRAAASYQYAADVDSSADSASRPEDSVPGTTPP